MDWILKTLQDSPELAIFLALALGVLLGKLNYKGVALGSVTGVLLMGIVVGQLHLDISPTVKSTFFLLFLFAVGYSVGPQFVQSLKKEGIPQIIFACIVCVCCLLSAWGIAVVMGFDLGNTVGLLSGANTISAVIGVATDTINELSISSSEKTQMINSIPVAYAVTYIFGTAGTAWFLSVIGPKMLGGDVKKMTKEYEATLGGAIVDNDPTMESAYNGSAFRVVQLTGDFFQGGKTVEEVEAMLAGSGAPIYIERVRSAAGEINIDPQLTTVINQGDRVVLNGPLVEVLKEENELGKEIADIELLDFRVEVLSVLMANKTLAGKSLKDLMLDKERHGVIIRKMQRGNASLPLLNNVALQLGDRIEIEGRKSDVDRFSKYLGYAERPTSATDLFYVGLGIFLGGLLGSLTLKLGNIPLSLSASGGVLIMGIVFGWYRSRKPTFGAVPEPAIWLMNNLGLNVFIAIVGISAGPNFIAGLKASGASLFIAGIFVSLMPMVIGILLGKYVFKFHPAITLGACAGSRTTTAALGQVEEVLDSKVPALSYTTTYAIGNTLLIIWGVIIVLLMS